MRWCADSTKLVGFYANVRELSKVMIERGYRVSDALREYLARHTPDNVTELMDKALTQIGAEKDKFVSSATGRTLCGIEW